MQHSDLIDDDTDWYDDGGHTNPLGAKKITGALGEYLTAAHDLPDHRDSEDWAADYEAYYAYQADHLQKTEDLWSLLALLSVEDFTAAVEIAPDYDMDPVTRKLLDAQGDRLTEGAGETSGRLTLTVYGKGGEQLLCRTYRGTHTPVQVTE